MFSDASHSSPPHSSLSSPPVRPLSVSIELRRRPTSAMICDMASTPAPTCVAPELGAYASVPEAPPWRPLTAGVRKESEGGGAFPGGADGALDSECAVGSCTGAGAAGRGGCGGRAAGGVSSCDPSCVAAESGVVRAREGGPTPPMLLGKVPQSTDSPGPKPREASDATGGCGVSGGGAADGAAAGAAAGAAGAPRRKSAARWSSSEAAGAARGG